MARKVHELVAKVALMLSSGAVGYFVKQHLDAAAIQDWKQIADDAHATSERALKLATQRSVDRARRDEEDEE